MSAFKHKYDFVFDHISETIPQQAMEAWKGLSSGGRILDYGCGIGDIALRFANEFEHAEVVGMDLHNAFETLPNRARAEFGDSCEMPANLSFHQLGQGESDVAIAPEGEEMILTPLDSPDQFDFCYSWCVVEHIHQKHVATVLSKIHNSLTAGGFFYLKINPLYFSARGAHLYGVLPEPWVHLVHQHDELKKRLRAAVAEKRTGNFDALWHQYVTLNKLTADELVGLTAATGFELVHETRAYDGMPPQELQYAYNLEALRNKDILLVLRK